jgi:hypothetical protein
MAKLARPRSLLVALSTCVICVAAVLSPSAGAQTRASSGPSPNAQAQANLQTALTGAATYYRSNDKSYGDLLKGIRGEDTGLSYDTANGSRRPGTISLGNAAQWVVLTAESPTNKDCWVITAIRKKQKEKITGQTKVGIYYGLIPRDGGGRRCAAHRSVSLKMSVTGFPTG